MTYNHFSPGSDILDPGFFILLLKKILFQKIRSHARVEPKKACV